MKLLLARSPVVWGVSQFGLLVVMRGSGPEKDGSRVSVFPEDGCPGSQEHPESCPHYLHYEL